MQITRQSEYAIRTLMELAKSPFGTLVPTKLISENQEIPELFLQKTVQALAKAGLVVTQRGSQGGVRLARPAEEITISDVITALEGPWALNVCLSPGGDCVNKPHCRVRQALARAQLALVQELSRNSIADLVKEQAVYPGTFYPESP